MLERVYARRAIFGVATLGGASLTGVILAGCSRGSRGAAGSTAGSGAAAVSPGETPRYGGTLNLIAEADAPLDSQRTTAQASSNLAGAALSRLFRYKTGPDPKVTRNYELEPDLALRVESPDAVTWTFKLRPDATFHDVAPVSGHAVEAVDIKASFERALDVKNPNRGALGMIDAAQIETPSADTVVFKLKYPYAWFNSMVASPKYSWVFPREATAGSYDPAKVTIGSGPFIFQSYSPSVAYLYKKNPNWFENGRPYVDGMRIAIVGDDAQRLAQFTAGNLDNFSPSRDDLDRAKRDSPKATVITTVTSSGGGYPLYVQLGDPASPFQDIRLRRAVSMAMDRATIGKVIYNGDAQPAFIVPPGMGKWALTMQELPPETAQWYRYDPAEARKLVAVAGVANMDFKLRFMVGFAPFGVPYKTQGEMVSNMLNAAGIRSTLVPMDYTSDYVGGGKGIRVGNFPSDNIIYTGISTLASPDEFVFGYLHSTSTVNLEKLNDPQLDQQIEKSRASLDENERLKAIKDIQKYTAEKMYIVNGFPQESQYQMVQPWVRNYQLSSTGGELTEIWSKVWLRRGQ